MRRGSTSAGLGGMVTEQLGTRIVIDWIKSDGGAVARIGIVGGYIDLTADELAAFKVRLQAVLAAMRWEDARFCWVEMYGSPAHLVDKNVLTVTLCGRPTLGRTVTPVQGQPQRSVMCQSCADVMERAGGQG